MRAAANSKSNLDARIVKTKVKQPAARRAAVKKAASKVKATAQIDFVRSIRG